MLDRHDQPLYQRSNSTSAQPPCAAKWNLARDSNVAKGAIESQDWITQNSDHIGHEGARAAIKARRLGAGGPKPTDAPSPGSVALSEEDPISGAILLAG